MNSYKIVPTRSYWRTPTGSPTEQKMVVEATAASLLSGAIAGSLGVGAYKLYKFVSLELMNSLHIGASYPLDSIKTKSQALASTRSKGEKSPGMMKMFELVYQNEGIRGFYQGVVGVMIGRKYKTNLKFYIFFPNNL